MQILKTLAHTAYCYFRDQGFEDVSFDVTQAVKYWRDNPAQNSGVLVLADDDCVNFHSNHYTPESHHAYIDVTCKNIG